MGHCHDGLIVSAMTNVLGIGIQLDKGQATLIFLSQQIKGLNEHARVKLERHDDDDDESDDGSHTDQPKAKEQRERTQRSNHQMVTLFFSSRLLFAQQQSAGIKNSHSAHTDVVL